MTSISPSDAIIKLPAPDVLTKVPPAPLSPVVTRVGKTFAASEQTGEEYENVVILAGVTTSKFKLVETISGQAPPGLVSTA